MYPVSVTFGGETVRGYFRISGVCIIVSSDFGEREVIAGVDPVVTAERTLIGMVISRHVSEGDRGGG
jgi:hypothetical protein